MAKIEAKRLHVRLYIQINDFLHHTTPEYDRFKHAVTCHLPPADIATSKDVLGLLEKLETRGKISVGNYENLKKYFKDAGLHGLVKRVEEVEVEFQRALYPETETGETLSAGRPSIPIAEFDRLYVRQGPSRHPDDETVAKQPESAFFEGDQLHELRGIPDAPGRTEDETVAKQPESGLFGSGQVCDLNLILDDTERPRDEQRPSNVIVERPRDDQRLHTAAFYERPRDEQRLNSRENAYKSSHIFKIVQRSDACKDWRPLGRELGLEDPEFDVISNDYPQQLREQCYQMLRAWLQSAGRSATPKALIQALKSLDYNNVADDIIDYVIARPFDL